MHRLHTRHGVTVIYSRRSGLVVEPLPTDTRLSSEMLSNSIDYG